MEEAAGKARTKRGRGRNSTAAAALPPARLHAAPSGEWMEAVALRRWATEQLGDGAGSPQVMVIDLQGLEHLDASALQVLLAIDAEQQHRGGTLRLENISAGMRQWFTWAGAADLPGLAEARQPSPAEGTGTCAGF